MQRESVAPSSDSNSNNDLTLQGDADYLKYINEIGEKKDEFTFPNIGAGMKKLESGNQIILHAIDGMLRGAYLNNPYDFPDIKTFGATRPKYFALEVTKNSPLTPIFK